MAAVNAGEVAAATKIQSAFRGHKAKKELLARKAVADFPGTILATIPVAAAWKICGKDKELVAEAAPVHIIKTQSAGKTVHILYLEHDNAEPSGVFPLPLHHQVVVLRHASDYLMFPTIEYSVSVVACARA